jgi:hypothetical protein
MELRGERECRECGRRWSYFETESIACPDCGSPRSVSVDEATVHTGTRATLDLSDARGAVDEGPLDRVATLAVEAAREYRRESGFVAGGDLRPLDDEALLAAEVETVGTTLSRALQHTDEAEHYFLTLLRAPVDGERPGPDAVPDALRAERGLAVSRAVGEYRRDLRASVDEDSVDAPLASALSAIRAHRERIDALDGDVEPREAERRVGAVRDVYAYLQRDDEAAIARIAERLPDRR